jgi:hypothetical protein
MTRLAALAGDLLHESAPMTVFHRRGHATKARTQGQAGAPVERDRCQWTAARLRLIS